MTEESNNQSNQSEEEKQLARNRRRFSGYRYSFRGSAGSLVDTMVLELPGHFAYPKRDGRTEESS